MTPQPIKAVSIAIITGTDYDAHYKIAKSLYALISFHRSETSFTAAYSTSEAQPSGYTELTS